MEPRKIVRLSYDGERDSNGLPHGEGYLKYFVDEEHVPFPQYPDLSNYYKEVGRMYYLGHFEHGVRQGTGYLAECGLRPASPHEWYSEGEYDCGHLIRPEHPEGSYREDVCTKYWYRRFEGTWENDMPLTPRYPEQTIREDDVQHIRRTCKDELEKTFDFCHIP